MIKKTLSRWKLVPVVPEMIEATDCLNDRYARRYVIQHSMPDYLCRPTFSITDIPVTQIELRPGHNQACLNMMIAII
ncbi:hypothetical protein NNRS527_03148 (plasmid) [Nitrosospira sp. NRS527]|nr:hypothetical protein NNRS527_03148 [Nitrosospira sp. NRS527]